MIRNISVVNRFIVNQIHKTLLIDNLISEKQWALISIYSGDQGSLEFLTTDVINDLQNIGMKYFLSLNFWDITDKDYEIINQYSEFKPILFSNKHAQQIITFLDKIQATKDKIHLIVMIGVGNLKMFLIF